MDRKNYLILIILLVLSSCVDKYKDLTLSTSTVMVLPVAHGEYTLGDLFYTVEEPNNLSIETGVFHSITDTIPFNNTPFFSKIENADMVFRADNIMPFQLDVSITPIDSISNEKIGEEIFMTIVDAADYNEASLSIIPILSEQTLVLDSDQIALLKESNSLIITITFVWPYEKVTTSIIDDFFELNAFNLRLILNANLKL